MAATATLETLIDAERRVDALVNAARADAREIVRLAEERAAQLEKTGSAGTQQARAAAAELVRQHTQQEIARIEQDSRDAIARLAAMSRAQLQSIALDILRSLVEPALPP